MKQMEYRKFDINYREIIDTGRYKGFNYYVISFGTHPCSYIEIPKEHKLYMEHYMNDVYNELDVHGGITFSANHLIGVSENEDKWFIGWDYAHYGDYQYFKEGMSIDGHKWTIEELHEDVINVIEQLAEMGDD